MLIRMPSVNFCSANFRSLLLFNHRRFNSIPKTASISNKFLSKQYQHFSTINKYRNFHNSTKAPSSKFISKFFSNTDQHFLPRIFNRSFVTNKEETATPSKANVVFDEDDADDLVPNDSFETLRTVSDEPTEPVDDMRTRKTEVKDSKLIFEIAQNNLVDKYGDNKMIFPKDIMQLAGSPGAGKGLMTTFIMRTRGITAAPIETSSLLNSPEAEEIKSRGELVADRHVVQLVLQELLKSKYASGVIVDGFPRTSIQGECIKHLYDRMREYRRKYEHIPAQINPFRRPIFHITVLFIEEEQSVERQLKRGKAIMAHNRRVMETGVGKLKPLRLTDSCEKLARERYRQFKNLVFDSLSAVKNDFAFHFISADGPPAVVQQRIMEELKYQSSLELHEVTFEKVRRLSLASEVVQNSRYELVKRLDMYSRDMSELFDQVIEVLQKEFFHYIKLRALSGQVIIRTENPIFEKEPALSMALDLLCERGFTAVLDFHRQRYPQRVRSSDGTVVLREHKLYEFRIEFPRPAIRHTHRFLSQ